MVQDGPGYGQSLFHAPGVFVYPVALAVFQANGEEDFFYAGVEVLKAVHASVKCEVFSRREVVVEHGLMRDESDVFAYFMRVAPGVYTADPDVAR